MTKKVDKPERTERTRAVRVNSTTKREYIEEEPILDVETGGPDEEEGLFEDPFAAFNEIVTDNRQMTIHIWRLPNYEFDGRTSANGTEREFCGSIVYRPGDDTLLQNIQQRVPLGGVVSLELKELGVFRGHGLLKLAKPAQATPPAVPGQPILINQPAPAALPQVDPMTVVKQQAESFLAVANVIKQLQPEHAPAATQTNGAAAVEPAPFKERLLEGVLLKLVENPKPDSLERVADILSGGGKETSWVETLITGLGPHLGGFLSQIGTGLNAILLRFATGQPVTAAAAPQASATAATTSGVLEPAATDPAEYAWRRVLGRLLDDLFEHCTAIARGAMGIDVHSSAEAVIDLRTRFEGNETIVGIIGQLVTLQPDQVIDLCAVMVPPELQPRVLELKKNQAAITWLAELQTETNAILQESATGETNNEETSGD